MPFGRSRPRQGVKKDAWIAQPFPRDKADDDDDDDGSNLDSRNPLKRQRDRGITRLLYFCHQGFEYIALLMKVA